MPGAGLIALGWLEPARGLGIVAAAVAGGLDRRLAVHYHLLSLPSGLLPAKEVGPGGV
jgi:hypothetical protein